jgi:hypothetical protein
MIEMGARFNASWKDLKSLPLSSFARRNNLYVSWAAFAMKCKRIGRRWSGASI